MRRQIDGAATREVHAFAQQQRALKHRGVILPGK